MGLFYTWSPTIKSLSFYTYPNPIGLKFSERLIKKVIINTQTGYTSNTGDFNEHLKYDENSPLQKIDWKAYAKSHNLLIKDYKEGEVFYWQFDINTTPGSGLEAKLSQLSLWINEVFQRGDMWSLNLKKQYIIPSKGEKHFKQCMEAIAIYED